MSAAASRERQHREGVKLMSTTQGKFVWYDLMTSDSKAAESFYRSVIGWDAKDSGMTDRSYTLFSAGPMMVGGMMPISEEARAMGARPAWNGYVLVDDVDVYAERVKAAGGAIHRAPEDIPGVGRFSVAADPHGAAFNLFETASDEERAPAAPGRQAMSAGMNCMQATGQAPSPSIPACLAGPKPKPW